jgi:hypothetical protein
VVGSDVHYFKLDNNDVTANRVRQHYCRPTDKDLRPERTFKLLNSGAQTTSVTGITLTLIRMGQFMKVWLEIPI